jgi:polyferredoxin
MDPKEEFVDPRTSADTNPSTPQTAFSRFMDYAEKGVGEVSDVKETYARGIALIITWTFAVSAIAILVGIYTILRNHPADAEALLTKAAMPILKEAGTFLSSVFGPLLAFVLGYYFGERKSKDPS